MGAAVWRCEVSNYANHYGNSRWPLSRSNNPPLHNRWTAYHHPSSDMSSSSRGACVRAGISIIIMIIINTAPAKSNWKSSIDRLLMRTMRERGSTHKTRPLFQSFVPSLAPVTQLPRGSIYHTVGRVHRVDLG